MCALILGLGLGIVLGNLICYAGGRKCDPSKAFLVVGVIVAFFVGPTLTTIILGPVGVCIGGCIAEAVYSAKKEKAKEEKGVNRC